MKNIHIETIGSQVALDVAHAAIILSIEEAKMLEARLSKAIKRAVHFRTEAARSLREVQHETQ